MENVPSRQSINKPQCLIPSGELPLDSYQEILCPCQCIPTATLKHPSYLFPTRQKFSLQPGKTRPGRSGQYLSVPKATAQAAGVCGLSGFLGFFPIPLPFFFLLILPASRDKETIPNLFQIAFLSSGSLWGRWGTGAIARTHQGPG